jgi:adenosylcobinamide-GDP ribazoletransferase
MGEENQSSPQRPTLVNAFLTAIQFLLVSPAFIRRPFTAQELGASVGFFPLAGLILGGMLAGADWLMGLCMPNLARSALLLGMWVLMSGALHLDGFLDACDGLLGGFEPEQRLRIMRDERVGAYALAGGVLLLLAKFSAIASLSIRTPAFLLAPVLGRWAIAWAVTSFPYARESGLGKSMKDNATRMQLILASILSLVVTGATMLLFPGRIFHVLGAAAAAGLVAWLTARFVMKRIPGLTGDIYGAINELVELAVLIVLTIW